MENQALFSSKDKSKKLKCRLLQFLFGTLRVNILHLFVCIYVFQLSLRQIRSGTLILVLSLSLSLCVCVCVCVCVYDTHI